MSLGFGYESVNLIRENDSLFSPHRRLLGKQFHLLGNSSIPLRIWLRGGHYNIRFAASFEEPPAVDLLKFRL